MNKLRVAVLMGGESTEREISLISGKGVMENLDKDKYEVEGVILPEEKEKLFNKFDVVFIAMHGIGGEDGKVQGFLETMGLKYTGCGVLASAVGMNKKIFKKIMERECILMAKDTDKAPCVVKPANGGSSVGVKIVQEDEDLQRAIEEVKKYDKEILIEEYLKGIEISCGILGEEVLPVVEIRPKNDFFDYESKYSESGVEEICPAEISIELTKKVQEITKKVFEIIGGRGFGRVDFIIKDGIPYVLEINTIPGLTPNSLLPKETKAAGYSYSQMLDKIIELAI